MGKKELTNEILIARAREDVKYQVARFDVYKELIERFEKKKECINCFKIKA